MATQIRIKNIPQGFQSIITNGKHSIVGDEPIKSGGTDIGLAPSELVLAGLAMCKVATVRYIARKKGYDIRDVDAVLTQEVKRGPNRSLSTNIASEIIIEGDITEEQRKELMDEADRCYIHRLLQGEINIEKSTELLNDKIYEEAN